jgi:DNA-binding NarL/FixJ family response regulator
MSIAATRVVLADDHAVVREGTAELLERAGFAVVGQASSGDEALQLVRSLQPDVLVLDLSMPGLPGLEVIPQVGAISPNTAVLVLSAHEEEPYVRAAIEAGARGYISKAARGREVAQAVRAVADGDMVIAPALAARIMSSAGRRTGAQLTQREHDVLAAAARGLGNKQIASELGMSPRTVQTHLANIFGKLGVTSRTEAVVHAIQAGWIESR